MERSQIDYEPSRKRASSGSTKQPLPPTRPNNMLTLIAILTIIVLVSIAMNIIQAAQIADLQVTTSATITSLTEQNQHLIWSLDNLR